MPFALLAAGAPDREVGRPARSAAASACSSATLGTPFAPDLEGAHVFWEDVNEPPYRVDRMLTHLGLSGNLGEDRGHDRRPSRGRPGERAGGADWPALVGDSLAGFPGRSPGGSPSGHLAPNRTLPLGLPARLDGEERRLVLGEG